MINHAVFSEEAGSFISSKHQRLGEILQDIDPYLELRWIPPNMRTDIDTSRPYCVVHSLPDKPPYVVMYFQESDEPENILAQIVAGDNWGKANVLQKLEMQEKVAELFRMKEQMDAAEESADMAHFLMTNRSKNYVKWEDRKTGEKVKLDSNRRRVS
jgi:hypothetical protein